MWLKIDCDIQTNPKVMRFAKGRDSSVALGELVKVWAWARKHTEDGNVGKYPAEDIELSADVPSGTIALMESVGLVSTGWLQGWPEWGGREISERIRKNPAKYTEKYKAFINYYELTTQPSAIVRKVAQLSAQTRLDKTRGEVYSDTFETFWKSYPRKIGKGNAWKAWKKLTSDDYDAILTAVPKHAKRWIDSNTETQYIPHPATWLNGRRWEDEITKPKQNEAPV